MTTEIEIVRPMPTVEQLLKVFEDNNWTPCPTSDGVRRSNVREGKCCAMPALIKFAGDEYFDECFISPRDPEDRNLAYAKVEYLYGKEARERVWEGFDDYRRGSPGCTTNSWYALGWNLHKSLLERDLT